MNTPRVVTDSQQRVVWRWENQEPFGNNPPEENPSGLGNFEFPLRFPGQYFDRETNTPQNYFRDYDAATGRFLQSDPIGLRGGMNTYAYGDSNPLSFTDPLGLQKSAAEVLGTRVENRQPVFPRTTPREPDYPPQLTPEIRCKHRCYYRLLTGLTIEEAGIHGAAQVSSTIHKAAPWLSALGATVGMVSLPNCLAECESRAICPRPWNSPASPDFPIIPPLAISPDRR